MTSNAVALVATADTLAPLSQASREAAVTAYLTTARDQLAHALDAESVAAIKAEIATAADATKHLGLSKEIQSDAQEMVRRAEYTLGKAIRKGQEAGEIAKHHEPINVANQYGRAHLREGEKSSVLDYVKHSSELTDSYAMSDDVTEEQFEEVLTEVRAEGNQSRANVVRKIKGQKNSPQTRQQRADLIEELAGQGYSSRQMPAKVGVTEESVRQIARDYGIEINADKTIGGARRIDSNRVVNETCSALAGLAMGVDLIDYDALDPDQKADWANSLSESLPKINALHRRINKEKKESTQ